MASRIFTLAATSLSAPIIGPTEAIIFGTSAGAVLDSTLDDVLSRFLSDKEKKRIKTVATVAATKLKERLEQGESLRGDGFFDQKGDNESDASQLIEGVFLKAKNEHETSKIPYLANFMVNAALSQLPASTLIHLLKLAEDLSYQQLCLIQFFDTRNPRVIRTSLFAMDKELSTKTLYLFQQSMDLYLRNLLVLTNSWNRDSIDIPTSIDDLEITKLRTSIVSQHLCETMNLSEIPQQEINEIYWYLKRTSFNGNYTPPKEFLSLSKKEIEEM